VSGVFDLLEYRADERDCAAECLEDGLLYLALAVDDLEESKDEIEAREDELTERGGRTEEVDEIHRRFHDEGHVFDEDVEEPVDESQETDVQCLENHGDCEENHLPYAKKEAGNLSKTIDETEWETADSASRDGPYISSDGSRRTAARGINGVLFEFRAVEGNRESLEDLDDGVHEYPNHFDHEEEQFYDIREERGEDVFKDGNEDIECDLDKVDRDGNGVVPEGDADLREGQARVVSILDRIDEVDEDLLALNVVIYDGHVGVGIPFLMDDFEDCVGAGECGEDDAVREGRTEEDNEGSPDAEDCDEKNGEESGDPCGSRVRTVRCILLGLVVCSLGRHNYLSLEETKGLGQIFQVL